MFANQFTSYLKLSPLLDQLDIPEHARPDIIAKVTRLSCEIKDSVSTNLGSKVIPLLFAEILIGLGFENGFSSKEERQPINFRQLILESRASGRLLINFKDSNVLINVVLEK